MYSFYESFVFSVTSNSLKSRQTEARLSRDFCILADVSLTELTLVSIISTYTFIVFCHFPLQTASAVIFGTDNGLYSFKNQIAGPKTVVVRWMLTL